MIVMEYEIRSYIGTRKYQEDAADVCITEKGLFAVVCDGIGSRKSGGESSRLTVEYFTEHFRKDFSENFPQFISKAAQKIDEELNERYGSECGTTAVAVYIKENEVYWFSVGDSRLYMIRGGKMKQITTDHNYGYVLKLRRQKNIILLQMMFRVSVPNLPGNCFQKAVKIFYERHGPLQNSIMNPESYL